MKKISIYLTNELFYFIIIMTIYIRKGEDKMEHIKNLSRTNDKIQYLSPSVTVITLDRDIITESHSDPNMGEWDTDNN